MKSIMISVKPKDLANILNGEKTIEIRKRFPADYVGWVYIYCTKGTNNYLYWDWYDPPYVIKEWFISTNPKIWSDDRKNINGWFNGKVVARFWCNKVEEILNYGLARRSEIMMEELLNKSCLTMGQLNKYAPHKEYKDNDYIYAIHITKLEIFDTPREISEFYKVGFSEALENSLKTRPFPISPYSIQKEYQLTKAPQSFMYVEG